MMGGHGFSSYNKMGVLINDNEINSTWEGDNNILLQQTTKILLENMQRVMKGK
jgi:acyl-CoA oxidase